MAGEISFTLHGGYAAVVGIEERRVYDRIIESNVGVIATTGLRGELQMSFYEDCLLALTVAWA